MQAEDLGKLFRTVMYPRYGPAGNGFLRLHSTYRHDLKIYTSDEGRVQTSAAAFTQGLLDLEGTSLTPILVRSARAQRQRLGPCQNGYKQAGLPRRDLPRQFAMPILLLPKILPVCHSQDALPVVLGMHWQLGSSSG